MISLLDVNVLIALAWPNHVHHQRALAWFRANRGHGWATCSLTQLGFVRVSSSRRVIPDARTPGECIQLMRRMTELSDHTFWADNLSLTDPQWLDPSLVVGHRQITDAHLLALALRHQGRLATFDRGVEQLLGPDAADSGAVELIP